MNSFFNKPNRYIFAKAQAGFGLVQTMIAVGIMGIVMMGVVSFSTIMLKSQNQSNFAFQADTTRRSIVNALNGPGSWKATVMDAANNNASGPMLDCLPTSAPGPTQPGYVCTIDGVTDVPAGGTPLTGHMIKKIDDASGGTIYDATQPNFGINAQGTKCTTFVDPAGGPGNDGCPLRFNVLWSARCKCTNANCAPPVAGDTCVNPQVQLQVVAVYNPGANNDGNSPYNGTNLTNFHLTIANLMGANLTNFNGSNGTVNLS